MYKSLFLNVTTLFFGLCLIFSCRPIQKKDRNGQQLGDPVAVQDTADESSADTEQQNAALESASAREFIAMTSGTNSPVAPIGFGVGGGADSQNADLGDAWHNWTVNNFLYNKDTDTWSINSNLPARQVAMFSGSPIPKKSEDRFRLCYHRNKDGVCSYKEFKLDNSNVIAPDPNGNHSGYVYNYCERPAHNCYPTKELCIAAVTAENIDPSFCENQNKSFAGSLNFPGCANYYNKNLEIYKDNSWQIYYPPSCTWEELEKHTRPFVKLIKNNSKGRVWQVFNEPDGGYQNWLTPQGAAQIYNHLYPRAKNVDPTAKLYCCGSAPFLKTIVPGGTGPGNPEANFNKYWFSDFTKHLVYPLDGIHYHNYNPEPPKNEDNIPLFGHYETIKAMEWFTDELKNLKPKVNFHMDHVEQDLTKIPLIVTEWGDYWSNPDKDSVQYDAIEYLRCNPNKLSWVEAGFDLKDKNGNPHPLRNDPIPDVLSLTMRNVKDWYYDKGLRHLNHIGMFWFYYSLAGGPLTGLRNGSHQNTCLGAEYASYRQKQIVPRLDYFENSSPHSKCARMVVTLPGKGWGIKHFKKAAVYDSTTNRQLFYLHDLEWKHPECPEPEYYGGNDDEWNDSYYKFYIPRFYLQGALLCHPNRTSESRALKVRMQFEDGTPYTDFSNDLDYGAIGKPSNCAYTYMPLFAANATAGIADDGWQSGHQVQNLSNSSAAAMNMYIVNEQGNIHVCGRERSVEPLNSTTFLSYRDCAKNDLRFAGAAFATSTLPLASMVNFVNTGTDGKAGAAFQGASSGQIATKLYFPLVKMGHKQRTTSFFIQNTSDQLNDIVATFKVRGVTKSVYHYNIPPFATRRVTPIEAGISYGDMQVGALTVTANHPIAGSVIEHPHISGKTLSKTRAAAIQGVSAFTENQASTSYFCPLYRYNHTNKEIISGLQVQNVDGASNSVKMVYTATTGEIREYLADIDPGASHTFYAGALYNMPAGTVGAVTVTSQNGKKLLATVSESNQKGFEMKSTYNCFSKGSKKLYLPLAKEVFKGNTTGVSIQNAGGTASKFTAIYKTGDNIEVKWVTIKEVPPKASVNLFHAFSKNQSDWVVESGDPAILEGKVVSVTLIAEKSESEIVAIANEANDDSTANPSKQDNKNYEGFPDLGN